MTQTWPKLEQNVIQRKTARVQPKGACHFKLGKRLTATQPVVAATVLLALQ